MILITLILYLGYRLSKNQEPKISETRSLSDIFVPIETIDPGMSHLLLLSISHPSTTLLIPQPLCSLSTYICHPVFITQH